MDMYIARTTGRPYSESLTARVLMLSSIGLPALSLLGGGLGIGGLLKTGRREKFAWLSVVGNLLLLLLVCLVLMKFFVFACACVWGVVFKNNWGRACFV